MLSPRTVQSSDAPETPRRWSPRSVVALLPTPTKPPHKSTRYVVFHLLDRMDSQLQISQNVKKTLKDVYELQEILCRSIIRQNKHESEPQTFSSQQSMKLRVLDVLLRLMERGVHEVWGAAPHYSSRQTVWLEILVTGLKIAKLVVPDTTPEPPTHSKTIPIRRWTRLVCRVLHVVTSPTTNLLVATLDGAWTSGLVLFKSLAATKVWSFVPTWVTEGGMDLVDSMVDHWAATAGASVSRTMLWETQQFVHRFVIPPANAVMKTSGSRRRRCARSLSMLQAQLIALRMRSLTRRFKHLGGRRRRNSLQEQQAAEAPAAAVVVVTPV